MSMADVRLDDNSIKVQDAIAKLAFRAVEEACGELESQVKRNTAVDTGQTKNAWTHIVDDSEGVCRGVIGNPLENAIWEELGTGEYALNGDGRKGGWYYVDEKGDGHFTHGKRPRRPFWNAYALLKNSLIKRIQEIFSGGLS